MSKSEFDQYLALLSGLLRLSSTQREEIASELRDHLEERLGELLDQGMSRSKAIETALEEFGDAAGLASNFAQIFRRQRRRWMMRMTLGTAATIAAIALMTSALWPEGRSGPSPQRLVAQDKQKRNRPEVPLFSPTLGDADYLAEANLKQRIDVEYIELPLTDALEELEVQAELQFHVKLRYLEEIGIAPDVPVTLELSDVSVQTVLELMLEDLDLTYVIRDGVVLITTEEDFEKVAEVRVYNCRDLLEAYVAIDSELEAADEGYDEYGIDPAEAIEKKNNRGKNKNKKAGSDATNAKQSMRPMLRTDILAQFGGGMGGMGGGGMGGGGMHVPQGPMSREEQLKNIISIAVMPESWESMGGPGTIGEFDGMIVIRHNPRAHRKVEQVLHMLRDASGQQAWENPDSRHGNPQGSNYGSGGGGGGFF